MIEVPLEGRLPVEIPASSGIYRIVLPCEGVTKYYVGQSVNIRKRIKEHRYSIRRGTHDNLLVQTVCTSGKGLLIEVLELTSKELLSEREQFFIDSSYKDSLVNVCRIASAPPTGKRLRITGHLRQPIVGIRIEDLEIVRYPSMRSVDLCGFNSCLVNRCIRGHLSQHKGYLWVTEDDFGKHSDRILANARELKPHRFSNGVYKRRIEARSAESTLVVQTTKELEKHGFDRRAVYRILNTDKTHKGFTFRELKEDVSNS